MPDSKQCSTCEYYGAATSVTNSSFKALNGLVVALALIIPVSVLNMSCGKRGIVARVNGDVIYEGEFEAELLRKAGEQVLRELITERLIRREAEREGITVSRSEVDAELKRLIKEGEAKEGDKERLSELREKIELNLLLKKLCMNAPEAMPSTHEIISYYERHRDEFVIPERVRLRCIVLEDLASALSVYEAAKRSKDNFAKLASELSVDEATKGKGGDMGVLIVRNLSAKLRSVVDKLGVGDVSEPFELDGRWWIVRLEEHMPAQQQSIDDVRRMIAQMLREQKAQALQPVYIRRLWEKADVKVYVPGLLGKSFEKSIVK